MWDVEKIITGIKPKVTLLTHFGVQLWKARPWEVAAQMTQKTGIKVIAARDGMKFDLDKMDEITEIQSGTELQNKGE
jgi:hypothetical protein